MSDAQTPSQPAPYVSGAGLPEAPKDKLVRKLKEEPLIPIGSLLTCGALIRATQHLRRGNRHAFQHALRWRIYFQGLTVVGMLGGAWYYGTLDASWARRAGAGASPEGVAGGASPDSGSGSGSAADAAGGTGVTVPSLPGRPPTAGQVAKEEERQAQSRREWEERLAAAARKTSAEEEEREQRRLEAALLRGAGAGPGEGSDKGTPAGTEETPAKAGRRFWPTVGQDGRDRSR